MNPINVPALARRAHPLVQIQDGQAITISTEVARVFEKRHDHVLDSIRNLLAELPADHAPNFREMVVDVEIGSGATRQSPAYHLTRDGFTLLAMGFTGKKALAFKVAYIDAFNQMEAALAGQAQPAPVPQQLEMTMDRSSNDAGISPELIQDIVTTTTQSFVAALQQKPKRIDWHEVIEAMQNRQADITFPELTGLIHASLARFERAIDAEAFRAIQQRAVNQNSSLTDVSLRA